MHYSEGVINTESSLKAFFHDALLTECQKIRLTVTEHTLWYLTNLLHNYSRSEKFFDYQQDRGTLTPLADYYKRAIEAKTPYEQRLHLQRLGDVALFISGMFSDALSKRVVGTSYYAAMGESAYGALAGTASDKSREQSQAAIFSDLSERFASFVGVLQAVGKTPAKQNTPAFEKLLGKVDEWQRTGDPALAEELRSAGILLESSTEHH